MHMGTKYISHPTILCLLVRGAAHYPTNLVMIFACRMPSRFGDTVLVGYQSPLTPSQEMLVAPFFNKKRHSALQCTQHRTFPDKTPDEACRSSYGAEHLHGASPSSRFMS